MGSAHPAEQFFAGHPEGRAVAGAVVRAIAALGPHDARVSRSQVAFRRGLPPSLRVAGITS